jgi:hypothetical protein
MRVSAPPSQPCLTTPCTSPHLQTHQQSPQTYPLLPELILDPEQDTHNKLTYLVENGLVSNPRAPASGHTPYAQLPPCTDPGLLIPTSFSCLYPFDAHLLLNHAHPLSFLKSTYLPKSNYRPNAHYCNLSLTGRNERPTYEGNKQGGIFGSQLSAGRRVWGPNRLPHSPQPYYLLQVGGWRMGVHWRSCHTSVTQDRWVCSPHRPDRVWWRRAWNTPPCSATKGHPLKCSPRMACTAHCVRFKTASLILGPQQEERKKAKEGRTRKHGRKMNHNVEMYHPFSAGLSARNVPNPSHQDQISDCGL